MTGYDSAALRSLREATCGKDVKHVIETYGQDECNRAWKYLSPLDRTALQFANAFQGVIIHDYQPEREERPRTPHRTVEGNSNQW